LGKQVGAAKILPEGQVTIPIEARRTLKPDVGGYIFLEEEGGKLVVSKAVLKKT
jgi:bifunctional DNA-binding transcriptional regulator/antitoxin component of YhaV-PrlF toxin-antitoxin module